MSDWKTTARVAVAAVAVLAVFAGVPLSADGKEHKSGKKNKKAEQTTVAEPKSEKRCVREVRTDASCAGSRLGEVRVCRVDGKVVSKVPTGKCVRASN